MTTLERWRLMAGDEPVGVIVVGDGDFPWLIGWFEPAPAFSRFAELFDRELRLVEGDLEHELAAWEAVYQEIRDSLQLYKPNGMAVPEFLLHIRDGDAWFRYSDEPFESSPPG